MKIKPFIILLFLININIINIYGQNNDTLKNKSNLLIGGHFTPGYGNYFVSDDIWGAELGFSYNTGLDFEYNFNKYFAAKTGVSLLKFPLNYYYFSFYDNDSIIKSSKGNIYLLGLPLSLSLTTNNTKKINAYLNTGFTFYYPVSCKINDINYYKDVDNLSDKLNIASETSLGISINNKNFVVSLGLFVNYSYYYLFTYEHNGGVFVGLKSELLLKNILK